MSRHLYINAFSRIFHATHMKIGKFTEILINVGYVKKNLTTLKLCKLKEIYTNPKEK
jgi:hypothetical protein